VKLILETHFINSLKPNNQRASGNNGLSISEVKKRRKRKPLLFQPQMMKKSS
jgi:hypothetical protein